MTRRAIHQGRGVPHIPPMTGSCRAPSLPADDGGPAGSVPAGRWRGSCRAPSPASGRTPRDRHAV